MEVHTISRKTLLVTRPASSRLLSSHVLMPPVTLSTAHCRRLCHPFLAASPPGISALRHIEPCHPAAWVASLLPSSFCRNVTPDFLLYRLCSPIARRVGGRPYSSTLGRGACHPPWALLFPPSFIVAVHSPYGLGLSLDRCVPLPLESTYLFCVSPSFVPLVREPLLSRLR